MLLDLFRSSNIWGVFSRYGAVFITSIRGSNDFIKNGKAGNKYFILVLPENSAQIKSTKRFCVYGSRYLNQCALIPIISIFSNGVLLSSVSLMVKLEKDVWGRSLISQRSPGA